MKSGFLEKLIQRLDQLGTREVENLIQRLIKEKGFFENVFDALREGLIILAPDATITFLNHAAADFFGLEPEKTIGTPLSKWIRGINWEAITHPRTAISRDLEISYPVHRVVNFYLAPIRHDLANSENTASETSTTLTPDTPIPPEDTLIGYVMLIRDITDSRKQSEAAWESEKLNALTLLAAGVAHEIGNPLNSLGIHMQLLRRKLAKSPPQLRQELTKHVEIAEQELSRLDLILKQFLTAIRPTHPDRNPTDLNQLITQALEVLEPTLADRKVSVELDLAKNLVNYNLDPEQIKQALFNLFKNAYEAVAQNDGKITVRTSQNQHELRIDIIDNGCGISPEIMGSIFEPYRSQKKSGTGLGLLIVRRIIREHGGQIEVESEEHQGTRVSIHFPRVDINARLLAYDAEDDPEIIDLQQ